MPRRRPVPDAPRPGREAPAGLDTPLRAAPGALNTPFRAALGELRAAELERARRAAATAAANAATAAAAAKAAARAQREPPAPRRDTPAPPRLPQRIGAPAAELGDAAALRLSRDGARPLAGAVAPERVSGTKAAVERPPYLNDEEEALLHLAELVAGEAEFSIEQTHEFIEGAVPGLDRRVLARLRRGDYAVQASHDLHGLTRGPAKASVRDFLTAARTRGLRCVRVIHGRGLNSRDGEPVLKELLKSWLTRGGMAKHVLAFATARPTDGGGGAVYVLLRRPGREAPVDAP